MLLLCLLNSVSFDTFTKLGGVFILLEQLMLHPLLSQQRYQTRDISRLGGRGALDMRDFMSASNGKSLPE